MPRKCGLMRKLLHRLGIPLYTPQDHLRPPGGQQPCLMPFRRSMNASLLQQPRTTLR